jgi:hypothetical protein
VAAGRYPLRLDGAVAHVSRRVRTRQRRRLHHIRLHTSVALHAGGIHGPPDPYSPVIQTFLGCGPRTICRVVPAGNVRTSDSGVSSQLYCVRAFALDVGAPTPSTRVAQLRWCTVPAPASAWEARTPFAQASRRASKRGRRTQRQVLPRFETLEPILERVLGSALSCSAVVAAERPVQRAA